MPRLAAMDLMLDATGRLWLTEFEIGADIRHSGPTTLDVKATMFRDVFAVTHRIHTAYHEGGVAHEAHRGGGRVDRQLNADGSQVPSIPSMIDHNFIAVPLP